MSVRLAPLFVLATLAACAEVGSPVSTGPVGGDETVVWLSRYMAADLGGSYFFESSGGASVEVASVKVSEGEAVPRIYRHDWLWDCSDDCPESTATAFHWSQHETYPALLHGSTEVGDESLVLLPTSGSPGETWSSSNEAGVLTVFFAGDEACEPVVSAFTDEDVKCMRFDILESPYEGFPEVVWLGLYEGILAFELEGERWSTTAIVQEVR